MKTLLAVLLLLLLSTAVVVFSPLVVGIFYCRNETRMIQGTVAQREAEAFFMAQSDRLTYTMHWLTGSEIYKACLVITKPNGKQIKSCWKPSTKKNQEEPW